LKEQRFLIPGSLQSLTIRYTNHQRIQGEYIPQEIEITLADGESLQKLKLEFTRTDLPGAISFPFEIPQGYKQLSF
jgi:ssRNA-specific RNase YbeY (16S rRNA maturation enzyme)